MCCFCWLSKSVGLVFGVLLVQRRVKMWNSSTKATLGVSRKLFFLCTPFPILLGSHYSASSSRLSVFFSSSFFLFHVCVTGLHPAERCCSVCRFKLLNTILMWPRELFFYVQFSFFTLSKLAHIHDELRWGLFTLSFSRRQKIIFNDKITRKKRCAVCCLCEFRTNLHLDTEKTKKKQKIQIWNYARVSAIAARKRIN